MPGRYFSWKIWIERIAAIGLLIPGISIMAILVILVKTTSPGPAIFRQLRVGRNGRVFWMYKIRTMRLDAEADSGPVWACHADPRATRVGRILRKFHLDEFPQLWNVVRGEMGLIGPRPERPEFTQKLAELIPQYLDRLRVPPGITGLAQINLPPDSDLDSVKRKLALDLEYIATAGPWLDFRMFLCTAVRLLGLPGDIAMRMFGVARWVQLPQTEGSEVVSLNWANAPHAIATESIAVEVPGREADAAVDDPIVAPMAAQA
jgi:lipopolysaccharide/colanic/teichoic acid biosynthesis glycosyltransferase